MLHLFENESEHPEESKDDVFGHGEVVVSGAEEDDEQKVFFFKRTKFDLG